MWNPLAYLDAIWPHDSKRVIAYRRAISGFVILLALFLVVFSIVYWSYTKDVLQGFVAFFFDSKDATPTNYFWGALVLCVSNAIRLGMITTPKWEMGGLKKQALQFVIIWFLVFVVYASCVAPGQIHQKQQRKIEQLEAQNYSSS